MKGSSNVRRLRVQRGRDVRDCHQKLLVGVAGEKGLWMITFGPSFLDNGGSGIGDAFIQGNDLVKFNLLVEKGLYCRLNVVTVIVCGVVISSVGKVMVMGMMIMSMGHFDESMTLCWSYSFLVSTADLQY